MIAYKFLAAGAVGPFSRFAWPTGSPGPWVEAFPSACCSGIHACTPADLPYWPHDELWEAELEGSIRAEHKVVAGRGRLLRRIDAWNHESALAFSRDCAERAQAVLGRATAHRARVYGADLETHGGRGKAAAAAFLAARIAELVDGPTAYDAERAAQARWLVDRLDLVAP